MIQETIFPFKLELTKEVLTTRSGLALFSEYNYGIGLRELVDKYLPAPGSNRGKAPLGSREDNFVSLFLYLDLWSDFCDIITSPL